MTEYKCYCPAYNIGMCDTYSGKRYYCKYPDEAHVPCENNHLCNDADCKLGHSISYKRRNMIITIYNKYYNGNNPEDCCIHHYNCINHHCLKEHTIDIFNMRKTICNIIRAEDDNEAEWYYETFYVNYVNKNRLNTSHNIKTHSQPMFKRTEAELSEASTDTDYKKTPKSPVSSYELMGMKKKIDDDAIVDMRSSNVYDMLSMVVPNMTASKEEEGTDDDVETDDVKEVVFYSVKKEEWDDFKNELKNYMMVGMKLLDKLEKMDVK